MSIEQWASTWYVCYRWSQRMRLSLQVEDGVAKLTGYINGFPSSPPPPPPPPSVLLSSHL